MKQFTVSNAYEDEELREAIINIFYKKRNKGEVEDYAEIEDLYIDENNDVYVVTTYIIDRWEEEGHGLHTMQFSEPDFRYAILVASNNEIVSILHPEVTVTI